MKVISKHKVTEVNQVLRINEYLIGVFEALPSRKSIKKAIQKGLIFVDGNKAPSSLFVKEGMLIEYRRKEVLPENFYSIPLEIVFEDDYLAIVNKPAGLVSSGNQFRSLYNALPLHLKASSQTDALDRPHLVHRLDSATSGLMIAAKTAKAQIKLGQLFEENEIKKTYSAIVHGNVPENGKISSSIEGKEASSRFKKLRGQASSAFQYLSLVELYPLSGRTHQLRIHMKENESPILGDRLYGDPDNLLKGKGLFLSATELEFIHPISNEKMHIKIDPPAKFKQYLAWTKKRFERDSE